MAKNLKHYYICDFETLNKVYDCRVWSWASCSLHKTDNIIIGDTIESFINYTSNMKKSFIFFHNLKFDGGFIDNYLLNNGFSVVENKNELERGTFTATISSMGQWYTIDIMFENGSRCTIYDSLKKLPFKVKQIAKAFKMKIAKGEIDYDKFRPVGYQLSDNEIEYIKKDVKIVADALKIQYDEGMDSMTVSKDSLNDYIATIGGDNRFRNLFPMFSNELHENLKLAYRGGWVYVKEDIAGKEIGKGKTYDITSLYPSQMRYQLMPYGFPISFDGKYVTNKQYPLFIQHVQCEFELKKDHLPTIQMKGDRRFKASEYLKSSKGETLDLYLTNIDLQLFKDHYDVYNLDYISGFMFKGQTGMFDKYIDKHLFVKNNSKGAIRELAKLKLNSLYGKFGSDIDVTGNLPYLKDDGSTGYRKKSMVEVTLENGKKRYRDCKELHEYKEPVYIPIAIFTTSYGRDLTIRSAQLEYDRFCYGDTDSNHFSGIEEPTNIKHLLDDKKLGFFKHESDWVNGKFLRAKTYIEEICIKYERDEKGNIKKDDYGDDIFYGVPYSDDCETLLDVKCSGLDDQAKPYVTFDNFYIGSNIKVPEHAMKLRPKRVKGGIVLEKQEINIRATSFVR